MALICVAQFVVVLDVTIVATALPAIGADLGFSGARVTWVVTAYTIVQAGTLLAGGRVADLVGPRRAFRAGLIVFGLASAACAAAWSPAALIVARLAQGCGAALLSPAALACLHELATEPGERRRALGWWTAAAAGGGAAGWVLGGLITEVAGWRWVFAVNVPVAVVALVAAAFALSTGQIAVPVSGRRFPGPATGEPGRRAAGLDLWGAMLVTAGIAAGVGGLSLIGSGPGSPAGWVAVGASVLLLAWFIRHERRIRRPLVPRDLQRRPGVLGGNLTAAALTASTTPAMLTAVLYVQDTLRLPPTRGALLFPAFNVAVIAGSLACPRILGRVGARRILLAGFGLIAAGTAVLMTLPRAGIPVPTLVGAFVALGAGLGAASVASTAAGTQAVPAGDRGLAAGLLNSTAQLGTALGLAVASPLIAAAAPMTGYRLAFAAAGVIALAGAAAAATVPRHAVPTARARARTPNAEPDSTVAGGPAVR